jgi:transglutaminase/protease-like cytokinesis protein 3
MVINISYSYKQFYLYYPDMDEVSVALDKRFAICDAYAETFNAFMKLLGIKCIMVISEAMEHAWNMVKPDDGCWYHIDVTWDTRVRMMK